MSRLKTNPALILHLNPASPVADHYRDLRINLEFVAGDRPAKTIAVISAFEGEGKSTTTLNLAIAYAQAGKKTLLIDADMRKPSLHLGLQISNHLGLAETIRDVSKAGTNIRDSGIPNLYVLPAGRSTITPSELLASSSFETFLQRMREQFDAVLIDTPPALSAVDAKIVAAKCDGTLLVIQQRKVKRDEARKVKEELEGAGARLLGVALNKMNAKEIDKYPY